MLKKVVVIGPESTGKSTLCQQLATHYNTNWCAEFAREYLLTHGTKYDINDLELIAKGQLALEDTEAKKTASWFTKSQENIWLNTGSLQSQNHPPILFIDTDMYVMKVWANYVFNQSISFVEENIKKRKYDLYLLCQNDLPWVKDELREYPNDAPREELYNIYKNILQNQPTPFVIINGDYEERLQKAITAVQGIL
jgi:nicotinamide riboside kinase